MKKILVLAIASMASLYAPAQTRRADTLYAHWNYYKASERYEKAAAKNPTQDVYYKLGECYQKMHNYKNALTAYDKVAAIGHYTNAAFYLNYGLMLKTGERYPDAKAAFKMYTDMTPSDPRGAFYMNSCDTVMNDRQFAIPITISAVSSLNSSSSDLCPILYKDGLVYISSREADGHGSKIYGWDGEHYLHVFYAKKGNGDTNFKNVTPMAGDLINKKYHNGPVCFSKNFDTIYFNSVNKDLKGNQKKTLNIERNKIYWAVSKNGEWVDMKPFQYNNDTFSVATPYLTKNGSRLYFSSDMPGGYGGADIYYCDKQGTSWGKPVNMGPNINTFGNEKFPSIDSVGDFYFSSDGYQGYGGMDICVSVNNGGSYGKASVLKAPYNSAGDDYGITFVKEGKIGYFSSNRNGGKGDEDIYYFNMDKDSLPCPIVTSTDVMSYRCPPKQQKLAIVDTIIKDTTHTYMAAKPAQPIYNARVEKTIMRIPFDFNKSNIRPDAAIILDSIIAVMHANPGLRMNVNGYCDSRGTYPYNQVLSEQRSKATVTYMVSKGIARKRLTPKGYGKTKFLNGCSDGVTCTDTEEGVNRRVEMWFMPVKTVAVSSIE